MSTNSHYEAEAGTCQGFSSLLCQTDEEIARCMAIRLAVFVDEQGYSPEVEVDDKDATSDHLLLLSPSGQDIATVRLYPPTAKLGRLAVSCSTRGTGAGRTMMRVLEQHVQRGEGKMGEFLRREKAGQEGGKSVVQIKANVQSHAQGFYAKCGYLVEGHEFLEEGQPHVRMTKVIEVDV